MSEPTALSIAENLRAAIKASGLTQREVAERTDMDPTALSKVLSGDRKVSSLELALICTATHTDVLSILGADPLHGPSVRRGYAEAKLNLRRAFERGDDLQAFFYGPAADLRDGDFTGCGAEKDGHYCNLPPHEWPDVHHADVFWEGRTSDPPGPSPAVLPEKEQQRDA